ncbi:MAG: D-alanine--poly(phosphoribitol) ligase subunit 2 [Gemmatimonadetes bacterium]|nr:D-alanine--poly(phosphoribitol) ligase subunit 2 [Gemmatimonadota bacterium]
MVDERAVYELLARVVETGEVSRNPDIRWYDLRLVDSLRTVEIIVELEQAFEIDIAPSDVDADLWATPRHVAEFVKTRVVNVKR